MSNSEKTVKYGNRIAWVDVETTSLMWEDLDTLLLEVGILITDLELREVRRESVVIHHSREMLMDVANWDPVAASMHTASLGGSGLTEECIESMSALDLVDAEDRLVRFLAMDTEVDLTRPPSRPGCGSGYPDAPLWGGCSPMIDRMMLKRCMPRLYERIHYRTLDATCLREAMRLWIGKETERSSSPHRGLEDAVSASKLANVFRRFLLSANKALEVSSLATAGAAK